MAKVAGEIQGGAPRTDPGRGEKMEKQLREKEQGLRKELQELGGKVSADGAAEEAPAKRGNKEIWRSPWKPSRVAMLNA